MRIAVIGAGYVGSVTAAGFASVGTDVCVYDVVEGRAGSLAAGQPAIHEPGLLELARGAGGRLRAAPTLHDALAGAEAAFICVQTPGMADGTIDLAPVEGAVAEVAAIARSPLLVVIRSTVVPGTTDRLDGEVLAERRRPGVDLGVAANPEFLREGRAVDDFLHPDRIVIGVRSRRAATLLRSLYAAWDAPVLEMTPSSAELAKYASNALLATLVSFSNELADIAEAIPGADVTEALRALQLDRRWRDRDDRWGPTMLSYLWPGCGYGGSCLPKDVKAIIAHARQAGVATPLLEATDAINERRAERVASQVAERVRPGARVAVLGTAFKAGTDDVRSSPGLELAHRLRGHGLSVVTYDPIVGSDGGASAGRSPSLEDALGSTDAWVVATWADEFRDLADRARAAGKLLVDARRRFEIPSPDLAYLGPGLGPVRPDR